MRKNIIISVILLAVIAVLVVVLKNRSNNKVSDIKTIAYVVPTLDNPFFIDMTNGAKEKIGEWQDYELIIQATQKADDAIGQNQIVENLITQGVDLICIVPINSESILSVLKKVNNAEIPIINVDNKINMDLAKKEGVEIAAYIGSDNFDGGILAGNYVADKLQSKGEVAILEGVSGNDAAINRKAGFEKAISEYPDIKIVTSQVANWNREQAFNLFQNILQANRNLDAVFACNDEMALGAYAALEQSGISKDEIIIVGFDAVDEARKAVKEGKIDATIAQQPSLMGNEAINLATVVLNEKEINFENSTSLKVILNN